MSDTDKNQGAAADTGKITLIQFILHDHSLFGLCFAKNRPPSIAAGSCNVKVARLTVRHRLFIFLFAAVAAVSSLTYPNPIAQKPARDG